jgi:hypothetical protein
METGLSLQNSSAPSSQNREVAHAESREKYELQSQLWLAAQRPRNEAEVYGRIIEAAKRPSFALKAAYAYSRAGQTISGPSVILAREAARIWGNVKYGVRVIDSDPDYVHLKAYAFDLESNALVEAEDKFQKSIQRKNKATGKTEWVEPDERDSRELLNRRGAFLVRNCLLQIIPGDIVEDCLNACRETNKRAASGDLTKSRTEVIRSIVGAFSKYGVDQKQLEAKIGRPLSGMSEGHVAEFREILASIKDGHTNPGDHFEPSQTQSLADKIAGLSQEQPKSEELL